MPAPPVIWVFDNLTFCSLSARAEKLIVKHIKRVVVEMNGEHGHAERESQHGSCHEMGVSARVLQKEERISNALRALGETEARAALPLVQAHANWKG